MPAPIRRAKRRRQVTKIAERSTYNTRQRREMGRMFYGYNDLGTLTSVNNSAFRAASSTMGRPPANPTTKSQRYTMS